MPIDLVDVAILLVSSAACVYCVLLSRRLKSLQNTKDGLGGAVVALTASMAATSKTTADTRVQVAEMADKLVSLLAEAEKASEQLRSSTEALETARSTAETLQNGVSVAMKDFEDRAEERIGFMTDLIQNEISTAQAEMSAMTQRLISRWRDRVTEITTDLNALKPNSRTPSMGSTHGRASPLAPHHFDVVQDRE